MSDETHTFEGAIQRVKGYSDIRFTEVGARELIKNCLLVHENPGRAPELWQYWEEFRLHGVPQIITRLKGTNWTESTGHDLVLLCEGSLRTRHAVNHFLPQKIGASLGDRERRLLWMWFLLLVAYLRRLDDPYEYLAPWAIYFHAGPYAERELRVRRVKHPADFAAGMIAYSRRTGDDNFSGAHELISVATKELARATRRRLTKAARKRVDEESKIALVAQVEKTLFDGFSGIPEELMALALDNKLGAVTAIKHDVLDEIRRDMPRPIAHLRKKVQKIDTHVKRWRGKRSLDAQRRIEDIAQRRIEEFTDEIETINHQLDRCAIDAEFVVNHTDTPEDRVAAMETSTLIAEFQKKYPKQWALIKMVDVEEIPQVEIARQLRRSPSTINEQIQSARRSLREFLESTR